MSTYITIDRATLEQALEALATADNIALVRVAYTPKSIDMGILKIREARDVIRQALARPVQEPAALQKSGIANSPSDPEICNERSAQACGAVYCGDSGGYCNKCP